MLLPAFPHNNNIPTSTLKSYSNFLLIQCGWCVTMDISKNMPLFERISCKTWGFLATEGLVASAVPSHYSHFHNQPGLKTKPHLKKRKYKERQQFLPEWDCVKTLLCLIKWIFWGIIWTSREFEDSWLSLSSTIRSYSRTQNPKFSLKIGLLCCFSVTWEKGININCLLGLPCLCICPCLCLCSCPLIQDGTLSFRSVREEA